MSIFSRGGNLAISGFWSKFDYRPALGNLRGNQIYQNIFACMNWSDVFTILFHEFLPRIFQSLNSWKRYTNFFGSFVSPIFFFSVHQLKKNHIKHSSKKNSWIRNSRLVKLSDEFNICLQSYPEIPKFLEYNYIFLSERRHYNLFHPLRDHQISWTGLFTFGTFWNLLEMAGNFEIS